jgi:hypothetical protein
MRVLWLKMWRNVTIQNVYKYKIVMTQNVYKYEGADPKCIPIWVLWLKMYTNMKL